MNRHEFESRLAQLHDQVRGRERAASTDGNVACVACENCQNCTESTFCRDGKNLVRCQHSDGCIDCTECANCRACHSCVQCTQCIDCDRCVKSAYLVRSSGCSGCTYCFGCVGLSRRDFHILNERYERDAYFRMVEALSRELGIGGKSSSSPYRGAV